MLQFLLLRLKRPVEYMDTEVLLLSEETASKEFEKQR